MIRIGDKVNTNIHPMSIVWVVSCKRYRRKT